jgi:hypothetical protein
MLGDSWVNLGRPNAGEWGIRDLLNLGDGIVLAGTWAPAAQISHYYRSINYGVTWIDKGTLIRPGRGVYFTDCQSGVIIAGRTRVEADVERSADYGETWGHITRLALFLNGASVGCYCGSDIVLLGVDTGGFVATKIIFKSTDKGLNWDGGKIPTADTMTAVTAMIYLGGGIALAGLGNGEIARTTDTGGSWTPAVKDFGPDNVVDFVHLGSGVVLCLLENNGDVWKSTDNGLTWSQIGSIGQGSYTMTYGGGMLFAGAQAGAHIFRSIDDGVGWTDLGSLKDLFSIGSLNIVVRSLAYGTTDTEEFLIAGLFGVEGDSYICRSGELVTTAPPDTLLCEQVKNPTNVSDPQPEFSAIYRYE